MPHFSLPFLWIIHVHKGREIYQNTDVLRHGPLLNFRNVRLVEMLLYIYIIFTFFNLFYVIHFYSNSEKWNFSLIFKAVNFYLNVYPPKVKFAV